MRFLPLLLIAGCAYIKPQTQLSCEIPNTLSARDTYTQALCAGWPFPKDQETVIAMFFQKNKPLSYTTLGGNRFNTAVPLSAIDRGYRLSKHRATHVIVFHNHPYRGARFTHNIGEKDLAAMAAIEARCLKLGLILDDFVIIYPNNYLVSAKHGGWLK